MSEEELEMLELTINADKVFDVNFHNVSKELFKAYKDLQQENKQLKEDFKILKTLQMNTNNILNELEEWLNKEMLGGRSKDNLWLQGCYDEDKLVLNKIQELKEKYK